MTNLFGEETIRTLGLYQPYATLMLHGKIETRWVDQTKKPPFPKGKYLIYSTKKSYTPQEFKHIAGEHADRAIDLVKDDESLLNGFGLCIGDLWSLRPMTTATMHVGFVGLKNLPAGSLNSIDDFIGIDGRILWGLSFTNMRRIKPFPFKGKQGIGFLTAEQKQLIQFV